MIIDELQILLTGDASGITNIIKQATNTVVGGIDKMNDQEVDWTAIFTGALSPAIISAVAGLFAVAIANLVNESNSLINLNNPTNPAGGGLESGNTGLPSQQAINLSESSGASLSDSTAAYEAFTKAGLDSAAATEAVNDATGIAYSTGESLSSVVTELIPLFQSWGITTSQGVTDALTGLANAAKDGTFTFDQLVAAIAPQGQFLQTKTSISDTAISLAALSTQSGLSQTSILNAFAAISEGSSSSLSQMSLMVGNVSGAISSGPDGLITAFEMIETKAKELGPSVSQTILSTTGLTSSTISGFSDTTITAFKNADTAAQGFSTNMVPLNKLLSDSESWVAKLQISWNKFATFITSVFEPPIQGIIGDFQAIGTLLTTLNGLSGGAFGKFFQSLASDAGKVGSAIAGAVGGANSDFQKIVSGQYGTSAATAQTSLNQLTSSGINQNQLNSILSAGEFGSQSSLVTALTKAIQAAGSTTSTNLINTFKLTIPTGSPVTAQAVAQQLSKQLYSQFQATAL